MTKLNWGRRWGRKFSDDFEWPDPPAENRDEPAHAEFWRQVKEAEYELRVVQVRRKAARTDLDEPISAARVAIEGASELAISSQHDEAVERLRRSLQRLAK